MNSLMLFIYKLKSKYLEMGNNFEKRETEEILFNKLLE